MKKGEFILISLLFCAQQIISQTLERKVMSIDELFELADINSRRINSSQIASDDDLQAIRISKKSFFPSI